MSCDAVNGYSVSELITKLGMYTVLFAIIDGVKSEHRDFGSVVDFNMQLHQCVWMRPLSSLTFSMGDFVVSSKPVNSNVNVIERRSRRVCATFPESNSCPFDQLPTIVVWPTVFHVLLVMNTVLDTSRLLQINRLGLGIFHRCGVPQSRGA